MRQALNNNPMVQIGFIAVLAIVVVFLLMTRVLKKDEPPADPAATSDPAAAGSDAAAAAPTTPPAPAGEVPAPVGGTEAPPTTTEPAPAAFEAGPGLPGKVVSAHEDGDTVVLLITRKEGIDDDAVLKTTRRFDGKDGVALFDLLARDIADYSRVAQGVEVDRVPALIVLSPRKASEEVPVASVSYGFRGPKSVEQAIADAGYDGKEVPYFPE